MIVELPWNLDDVNEFHQYILELANLVHVRIGCVGLKLLSV